MRAGKLPPEVVVDERADVFCYTRSPPPLGGVSFRQLREQVGFQAYQQHGASLSFHEVLRTTVECGFILPRESIAVIVYTLRAAGVWRVLVPPYFLCVKSDLSGINQFVKSQVPLKPGPI